MNSRQRVLMALHHQEPDRVPLNYLANPGIHARLLAHFGLQAADWDGLGERLGVDFRGIYLSYKGPPLHPPAPNRQIDEVWGTHTQWIEHASGGYWDYCDFPLKDAAPELFDQWPMPSPDDFDYTIVPAVCQKQHTYAIHTGHAGFGDILNTSGMFMGVEQALMDIIDPDSPLQLTDRRLAAQLGILERTLEAGKGRIDFLWLGEDLGTQRGPIISLDTYRRFLRPRHQKFVDLAKAYDIPVMIHCCGSSSWAFDDFVEMGIGVVDTLQPEAADMAPAYLKARWGGKLAFHGCISTAGAVACGTVEDVRREVRQTLAAMMPGGGYCLAPTHQLQDNSPTENVLALYDQARQAGAYRH